MVINIRKETEKDYEDIKSVNDKAFGQENEGKIVENLRKNEKYISDLSLVAEIDNKIVGHILFFPIKIISQENEYETLSLAPMSVLPNYQKMGIGSKLIKLPFEVPDNAFMALELLPNSLKGKQGTVKYPKEYNDDD
jgi:putative acetyltransferase